MAAFEQTAPISEAERVAILEDLARNSDNSSARVAAIRQLRVIAAEREEGEPEPVSEFARLYEASNPGRIRSKLGAAPTSAARTRREGKKRGLR